MNTTATINRSNNLDFLRLLFASLVIVSHSFPLTGQPEIAGVFTNDQLSLGSLSVDCFFIMSGYLIFQSLERSKTLLSYLWKRILRLFPALFILLIITLLILPFLYNGADISKESSYWSYLPNGLSLYRIQYNVNGVFENNLYPKAINGSLWSLSYEFTLYLILMIIFPFRKNKNIVRIIMIIIFLICYILLQFRPSFLSNLFHYIIRDSSIFYKLAAFFFAGSILSFFNLKTYNTLFIRIGITLSIILSLIIGCYQIVAPFLLSVLTLQLATLNTPPINMVGKKWGDISYGVYIYGFLLQQILMNYLVLNPFQLMLISLPATYILASFSWHLVEEKMLRYKNIL